MGADFVVTNESSELWVCEVPQLKEVRQNFPFIAFSHMHRAQTCTAPRTGNQGVALVAL